MVCFPPPKTALQAQVLEGEQNVMCAWHHREHRTPITYLCWHKIQESSSIRSTQRPLQRKHQYNLTFKFRTGIPRYAKACSVAVRTLGSGALVPKISGSILTTLTPRARISTTLISTPPISPQHQAIGYTRNYTNRRKLTEFTAWSL